MVCSGHLRRRGCVVKLVLGVLDISVVADVIITLLRCKSSSRGSSGRVCVCVVRMLQPVDVR